MGIKVTSIGNLPEIDLDHIHFTQTNITISEKPPYKIAMSAKIRPYGMHGGVQYFAKDHLQIAITDLEAYIGGLEPANQLRAIQAMAKVQEGLGVLAELKLGIDFVGVD